MPESKRIVDEINQEAFISFMMRAGYTKDKEGVCFGIAHMAKQALLAEKMPEFIKRIKRITAAHENKEDLLAAIEEVRNKIKQKKPTVLTENDRELLDIMAFFDGVEMYQNANFNRHRDLFSKQKSPARQAENVKYVQDILIPESLKAIGIQKIDQFTGIHTAQEIENYLNELTQIFEKQPKINCPVAFDLGTLEHAIAIGYQPGPPSYWTMIDANNLQWAEKKATCSQIAKAMVIALGFKDKPQSSDHIGFTTHTYVSAKHADLVGARLAEWKKGTAFQETHSITEKKLKQIDCENSHWIHIACYDGDLETVTALLKEKVNPDIRKETQNNDTPLHIAAREGHHNIIQELLQKGADTNKKNNDNATPLSIAIEFQDVTTVKSLLKSNINWSTLFENNKQYLHLAAEENHLGIATLILNANPKAVNESSKDDKTALDIAIKQRNPELILLLLKNGANKLSDDSAEALFRQARRDKDKVILKLIEEKLPLISQALHRIKNLSDQINVFGNYPIKEIASPTIFSPKSKSSTDYKKIEDSEDDAILEIKEPLQKIIQNNIKENHPVQANARDNAIESLKNLVTNAPINNAFITQIEADVNAFQRLDALATSLLTTNDYNPESKKVAPFLEKLTQAVAEAYAAFANNPDDTTVISTLRTKAYDICNELKKAHHNQLFHFFAKPGNRSKMAEHIENALLKDEEKPDRSLSYKS